jgi:uncharacterized membrane protein YkvA (DUF1232 family)
MTEKLPQQDQDKTELSGFVRMISTPLSHQGVPRWLVYTLGVLGGVYILNPTLGIFELIPDVLPIVGNIDESLAVMLILAGIVEAVEGRKVTGTKKQVQTTQTEPDQMPKDNS